MKLNPPKRLYRRLVPKSIRFSPLVQKLKSRVLAHDALYDEAYYNHHQGSQAALDSAAVMAKSILADLHPQSVVDVGCGGGALLARLQEAGCTVFGLEYSAAGLAICERRHVPVLRFDLETDTWKEQRRFDLAISVEVAEHLPKAVADRYVALLASLSDRILFTAAEPGDGGTDHVNEQPPAYWIEKFTSHSFKLNQELGRRWGGDWKASEIVRPWHWRNPMVFSR